MKWNDATSVKRYLRQADWGLLAFLILFLNVKLPVKIIAIGFVVFLHRRTFNYRDIIREKWIWFYLLMVLLAGVNWLFSGFAHFTAPALLSFALGCLYWLLAMTAAAHLFHFVQRSNPDTLRGTAEIFFGLHMLCVLVSFLGICIAAGSINAYTFQGLHQKYFINTGDYIKGIGFDSSVTSAMISAFGLLYFLYRGRLALSLLCMVTVLLAGSNLTDLLVTGILLFVFLCHTNRVQKSMILVYLLMIVVFMGKISPQNMEYAEKLLDKMGRYEVADAGPGWGEYGGMPAMAYFAIAPLREIDFAPQPGMVARQFALEVFMDSIYSPLKQDSLNRKYMGGKPGRWIAWRELGDLFRKQPGKILLGAGMGNFSSRLAFKTTGLGIGGVYPRSFRYINPLFRDGYLYQYLYYYTRDQGGHSSVNMPDSVYGQLLGEYGVAGMAAFLVLYAGRFLRRARSLSYGLPLVMLLGCGFFMEYWFEQLSVVVLFEFLMLLDRSGDRRSSVAGMGVGAGMAGDAGKAGSGENIFKNLKPG